METCEGVPGPAARTVLVLGGYGAVGREATRALRRRAGTRVVVAGRHPPGAAPGPGADMLRLDASVPVDLARALDETGADTVLMCAEADNVRVARACAARGVHYVDVTASRELIAGLGELHDLARDRGAVIALSVGLVPGVTNVLARVCVRNSRSGELFIGALLGAGEAHGPGALAWTVDGLGALPGSWTMRFPGPYGTRRVHRFPFSDQYTLPDTLGVSAARTGLCLDSRLATGVLALAGRPAVARLLHRPAVRDRLLTLLGAIHIGGDGFAVTVRRGAASASFSGRRQSLATGRVAALLIHRLPGLPRGVGHLEELVEPRSFLAELAGADFDLDLGPTSA